MKEFKASTKRGKELISIGNKCKWHKLRDIYKTWSPKKQKAFDWCLEQYVNDNHSIAFGVGNANTYGFTCSWLAIKDDENIMRIETKYNSYLVWLDR